MDREKGMRTILNELGWLVVAMLAAGCVAWFLIGRCILRAIGRGWYFETRGA
jgi:hypothetical protein